MPFPDGGGVRVKGLPSAGHSEAGQPVEINLHRALAPLSEEVRESLFERKEQLGLLGKTAPDRRSRAAPARATLERVVPAASPNSDRRSLLPRLSINLVLIFLFVFVAGFGVYYALKSFGFPAPVGLILPLEIVFVGWTLFLYRVLWPRQWEAGFRRNATVTNVLIVGVDSTGREVRDYLTSMGSEAYRFKGFVELNEATDDLIPAEEEKIVGSVDNVITLARSMSVDEIIFTRRPATPNVLSNVLSQARSVAIDVRLVPPLSEGLKNRPDIQYLGKLPTIVLFQHEKHAATRLMKRSTDIVLGSVAMVVLCPLLAVIAFLIKLQSQGPVLYRSKRLGLKGAAFDCYRFRTMVENADSMGDQSAYTNQQHGSLSKTAEDPRVTEIGVMLRKYSLDKLPQLWNVLSGEMSLVGPRPSSISEMTGYKTVRSRKLDVVPGMTGLRQIKDQQSPFFESTANLDSRYVEDWSIWLDLKIIGRALSAALKGTRS